MTITLNKLEIEALLDALYSVKGKDLPEGDALRAMVRAEQKLLGFPKNAETPLATLARSVTRLRESGEWEAPSQRGNGGGGR